MRKKFSHQRTVFACLEFGPEYFQLAFVFLKSPQPCTNRFADGLETTFRYLLTNEGIEMLTKCY